VTGKLVQNHQIKMTVNVKGSVIATYTHQGIPRTKSKLKTDDIKVPGRKSIVKAAMVFMDELSLLVSRAMSVVVALSCWVTKLNT
jgi:hypothetical protein